MERQHFVVLIDPVGRGRKTEHPVLAEGESACAARRERVREAERTTGRRKRDEEGGHRRKKDAQKWPSDEETVVQEGWKEYPERE